VFKVYTNKITNYGQSALVILTTHMSSNGAGMAESFCIFPPPNASYSFTYSQITPEDINGVPITLDQALLEEEAKLIARLSITEHLSKHYLNQSIFTTPGELVHQTNVTGQLAHYRFRDEARLFEQIERFTKCDLLKDFIKPFLRISPKPLIPYESTRLA